MMRSFGARPDTHVIDEPFYAAYLARANVDHPMQQEVLASQPVDWREVVEGLLSDPPAGQSVFYHKHMTHHMLPGFGLDWMNACRNAFLIRDPELVLASYTVKRNEVTLADIGFVQQSEIFAREADRLGKAPPVVEGIDVLRNPAGVLSKLCAALDRVAGEHAFRVADQEGVAEAGSPVAVETVQHVMGHVLLVPDRRLAWVRFEPNAVIGGPIEPVRYVLNVVSWNAGKRSEETLADVDPHGRFITWIG